MKVLGIETSCDESGIAVYDANRGLLAHNLYSQIQIHQQYGGVVPELASRDHIRKTLPLIEQTLEEAQINRGDLDGVAYTAGPGLMGALLVGATIGRSLGYALNIPTIGVHHMEGHLLAPMLEDNPPEFPFITLLVSGGHTLLVDVQGLGQYKILGESVDDAAGEAFDKTAKLLKLAYPGGPAIARLAESGDQTRFKMPRPMTNRPGLDFSFSGLKTFVANIIQQEHLDEFTKADIAAGFQAAVIDTLVIKCRRALEQTQQKRLVIAGGVSANLYLREQLNQLGKKMGVAVYYPRPEFCTDNGAMIAYAGYLRLQAGEADELDIKVRPRWPICDI